MQRGLFIPATRLAPPNLEGLFFMSKRSLQSPPPPPKKSTKWASSKTSSPLTLGCAMPIGHHLQQEDDELEAINEEGKGAICQLEEEEEEEEEEEDALEVMNEDPTGGIKRENSLLEADLSKEEITEEENSQDCKEGWMAYCLISENLNKTYVGITTDHIRRLRQHNGEIVGGAKANRSGRPWRFICIVHGFGSKKEACQFEWHWKHFSRKSSSVRCIFEGKSGIASSPLVIRRRKALEKVMKLKEWSSLSVDWYLE